MASRPEDEWILSERDARVQVWVTWLERWLSSPGLQLATGLAVAFVVATVSAAHLWVNWQSFQVPVSYLALLAAESVEWSAWAAVLPAVVYLDRRMSGRPLPVFRKVSVHLGFLFLIFVFQAATSTVLNMWLDPGLAGKSPLSVFFDRAVFKLPGVVMVYVLLVALVRLARSMVRQERLRQDFLNARLANLRAQLQPHFLFNTLNTTASLIREGSSQAAVESLVELSDLLRRSLSVRNEKEVPLAEELRFLRTYLSIQKRRFGERLHVEVDVEEGIEEAMVPFLVLQPLCENAVRHGLDLDREGGRLRVVAFRQEEWLILQVEDSGKVAGDAESGFGIGLGNLQERLRHLYGSSQALELEARTAVDGTRATVRLPFRLADDD
ncbi:MAG: histidine kinase [Gemmatimonadota bacterium]